MVRMYISVDLDPLWLRKEQKKIGRHIKKNVAIEIPEHFIPSFKPAKIFVEQVKEKCDINQGRKVERLR